MELRLRLARRYPYAGSNDQSWLSTSEVVISRDLHVRDSCHPGEPMKGHTVLLALMLAAQPAVAQLADPNATGVSFGHVHLTVADLPLNQTLWTDLFDGRLVERDGYSAVQFQGTLVFFTEGDPTAPSASTAVDHVAIRVRNASDVRAAWRRHGLGADEIGMDAEGREVTRITMPNGAGVEIIQDSALSVPSAMDHVHFASPHAVDLPAWYADLFGATSGQSVDGQPRNRLPGSDLVFAASEDMRAPTDSTAIDHIGFEVQDMQNFSETLRNKGIEFEFGPLYIESLDLWVAFFTDPGGVLVEITQGLDHFARAPQ